MKTPSWVADVIGKEWHASAWNCYTLVRDLSKEHLGKDLPDFHTINPSDRAKVAAAMQNESDSWFRVDDGGVLGDIAAIRTGRYVSHVGLIVAPWEMLHVDEHRPTHIARLRDAIWQNRLAGIYRRWS